MILVKFFFRYYQAINKTDDVDHIGSLLINLTSNALNQRYAYLIRMGF